MQRIATSILPPQPSGDVTAGPVDLMSQPRSCCIVQSENQMASARLGLMNTRIPLTDATGALGLFLLVKESSLPFEVSATTGGSVHFSTGKIGIMSKSGGGDRVLEAVSQLVQPYTATFHGKHVQDSLE